METIRLRNVSFTYPLAERKALDDVSFDIQPSQFIVVCGKSGCGKSTLLRHLKKNLM
ncbi:MAG: ATP-binding cassette domain-containing protein, partial [Firmicutes bacterium]|nr:ATP-binding cassette domain-containing protein [Bacillota bacterium]